VIGATFGRLFATAHFQSSEYTLGFADLIQKLQRIENNENLSQSLLALVSYTLIWKQPLVRCIVRKLKRELDQPWFNIDNIRVTLQVTGV
jgi:hypothetical protein